jgi:hypothetical protein
MKILTSQEYFNCCKLYEDASNLSNLYQHALRELILAGLLDDDSEGELGNSLLQLINVYCQNGYSNFASTQAREIFNKLTDYQTLTPLTSDPNEWMDVSYDDVCMFQNMRNPRYFSYDGGKTYWCIDDETESWGI